jgi:RsiW-degrading membrane proteinase PrsW (M82 family)
MVNKSDEMNFCVNCGAKLTTQSNFCPKCGRPIKKIKGISNSIPKIKMAQEETVSNRKGPKPSSLWESATTVLNQYTGESGPVNINLKNLFSEVFKRHSQNEAEEIFIAGTATTTPLVSKISSEWGRPWLFSRILIFFGLIFMLLVYIATDMGNEYAIPGVIMTGAFTVPLSALVFFFEMNAYRNISFYEVLKVFFLGGALSIFITVFLYQFVSFSAQNQSYGVMTWSDTISIGLVEELGKLLIVIYFVRRKKYQYILNGILIGAAVGSGFAAFETAGYIYASGNQLLNVALVRAATAIGGHVVWTTISAGALVMVKKSQKFNYHQLLTPNFLVFFGLVIILHAVWDKGINLMGSLILTFITLITTAWIIVFVLINAGLKQASRIKKSGSPANSSEYHN